MMTRSSLPTASKVAASLKFWEGCRSDLNLAESEKYLDSFNYGSISTCFVDLNMNIYLVIVVTTTRPNESTDANIQAWRSTSFGFCV